MQCSSASVKAFSRSSHPPSLLPSHMAMAIHQTDRRMRLSPINYTDRGWIKKDTESCRGRYAQSCTQHCLYRPHMRHQHNRLPWMRLYQLFNNGRDTSLHGIQTLPVRRRKRSITLPIQQRLSILGHNFGTAQTFPSSKVTLPQLIHNLDSQTM